MSVQICVVYNLVDVYYSWVMPLSHVTDRTDKPLRKPEYQSLAVANHLWRHWTFRVKWLGMVRLAWGNASFCTITMLTGSFSGKWSDMFPAKIFQLILNSVSLNVGFLPDCYSLVYNILKNNYYPSLLKVIESSSERIRCTLQVI